MGELTEHERFIIDRARQVAPALRGGDIRGQLAAQLLGELADLAERLAEDAAHRAMTEKLRELPGFKAMREEQQAHDERRNA